MSWQIFSREMPRNTEPMVSLMNSGRISLNKAASARFHQKAVERVLLLWNSELKQIAIKPISKKDSRSYKLNYSAKGNAAGVSSMNFYKFIGYHWNKTRSYPVEWSEEESMYVFTVPSDHSAVHTQRSVTGKRKGELPHATTGNEKAAANMTQ